MCGANECKRNILVIFYMHFWCWFDLLLISAFWWFLKRLMDPLREYCLHWSVESKSFLSWNDENSLDCKELLPFSSLLSFLFPMSMRGTKVLKKRKKDSVWKNFIVKTSNGQQKLIWKTRRTNHNIKMNNTRNLYTLSWLRECLFSLIIPKKKNSLGF